MAALWPLYFHPVVCSIFFLYFFFPRLISAVGGWMSTILPHMVWPYCEYRMQVCNVLHAGNAGPKKSSKIHHLGTIAQLLSGHIFVTKARIDCQKKLVKQQWLPPPMSWQYGELRSTSGWDRFGSLGHPYKFQRVLRLGSVTARHLVVGVS